MYLYDGSYDTGSQRPPTAHSKIPQIPSNRDHEPAYGLYLMVLEVSCKLRVAAYYDQNPPLVASSLKIMCTYIYICISIHMCVYIVGHMVLEPAPTKRWFWVYQVEGC